MFVTLLLALSLLMPAGSTDVVVATLPAKGTVTLPLAPTGKVEMKRDPTVTWLGIEVDHLAQPSTLGPALNTYVVWSISPEGDAENIGELAMDKDKGRLEATTRFEQVGLLITAEPHYMVDKPSSAVAFHTQAAKKGDDLRRFTVPIVTGTYDYAAIQVAAQPGVPTVAMEARAAFQIAQAAGADRLAESEFRRARVALDTMEQVLSRASPLEIVAQSANETIRRSQQAVTSARAKH